MENQRLKFSPIVSRMLGLALGEWTPLKTGANSYDIHLGPGLKKINVWCNLIHEERVGKDMIPLLRSIIVSKPEENTPYISITYNPTYYKRVRLSTINEIHCQLRTDGGKIVTFDQSGETVLLLHFVDEELLHNHL